MSTISKEKKNLLLDRGTGIFPKSLFIVYAFGGSVIIWVLKSLNLPQLITVIFPISFIITYCFFAYRSKLFYITEEKIGDNAYYLGFLYTLSSLSYALYKFSAGQIAPEYIIASFSVALWSTIIGIACRVFFSQLRQDPNDIEKETRIRIAETASHLMNELHQTSMAFNIYRRTLQQSIEETFMNLNDKIDEAHNESLSKITTTVEDRLDMFNSKFDEFNSKANSNANSLAQATEGIVKSLEMMHGRIDHICSNFENTSNYLDSVTKDQVQMISGVSKATSELNNDVNSLSIQIKDMNDRISSLNTNSKIINNVSDKIQETLTKFSDLLAGISNQQKNTLMEISNHSNALQEQLGRSRKYTEETHQSLAEMTRNLAEKLQ